MTTEHEDRMRNQTTSQGAGYANNITETTITDIVHKQLEHFVNQMPMFQQDPNDQENVDPNVPDPMEQMNAALTADELKDIMRDMMKDFRPNRRNNNNNNRPLAHQGTNDDGTKITYCWSHGITTNLRHTGKSCTRKKDGHKSEATLTNKMDGCTETCKPRN